MRAIQRIAGILESASPLGLGHDTRNDISYKNSQAVQLYEIAKQVASTTLTKALAAANTKLSGVLRPHHPQGQPPIHPDAIRTVSALLHAASNDISMTKHYVSEGIQTSNPEANEALRSLALHIFYIAQGAAEVALDTMRIIADDWLEGHLFELSQIELCRKRRCQKNAARQRRLRENFRSLEQALIHSQESKVRIWRENYWLALARREQEASNAEQRQVEADAIAAYFAYYRGKLKNKRRGRGNAPSKQKIEGRGTAPSKQENEGRGTAPSTQKSEGSSELFCTMNMHGGKHAADNTNFSSSTQGNYKRATNNKPNGPGDHEADGGRNVARPGMANPAKPSGKHRRPAQKVAGGCQTGDVVAPND